MIKTKIAISVTQDFWCLLNQEQLLIFTIPIPVKFSASGTFNVYYSVYSTVNELKWNGKYFKCSCQTHWSINNISLNRNKRKAMM